jgi:hypothetical protein
MNENPLEEFDRFIEENHIPPDEVPHVFVAWLGALANSRS